MAGQVKINQAALREFLTGKTIQMEMEKRANKILKSLEELAPKDSGDLSRSFQVEIRIQGGRLAVQIVSSDPAIEAIVKGTTGPYRGIPPWGPGSELGGWLGNHGFVSNKSKIQAAIHISRVGTEPNKQWILDAVKSAI